MSDGASIHNLFAVVTISFVGGVMCGVGVACAVFGATLWACVPLVLGGVAARLWAEFKGQTS